MSRRRTAAPTAHRPPARACPVPEVRVPGARGGSRSGRPAALALLLAASAAWGALPPGEGVPEGGPELGDRMRGAGLERVEALAGAAGAVRGLLPGAGSLRVLLVAGCGRGAAGGNGAGDAAAVAAALAAAADLARTPRRHTLELIVCPPGRDGSRGPDGAAHGWLSANPEAAARDRILGVLELDGLAAGGGPAAALPVSGSGPSGRRLTPAWLAHAVLAGAGAAAGELVFGELALGGLAGASIGPPAGPLLGQLLARVGRPATATGAAAFLAAGVPAVRLAGGSAEEWPPRLAGIVRRLDALAGRPRDDDAYLAVAGRVWWRRDLYWIGLVPWVALLASGLPGAWRGADSRQRRRRGRRYLPGFAFRMLFLLLLLLAPAETLVLVAPGAVVGLVTPPRRGLVWVGRLVAGAPAAAFAVAWLGEVLAGRLAAAPAEPFRLALVLAGAGLAIGLIGRPRRAGAAVDEGRTAARPG